MNPFRDAIVFLVRPWWPILMLWALLLASAGSALLNWRRDAAQRTAQHLWLWITRLFVGVLWWQQSLWKLPPTYTDHPSGVEGGLHHWVNEMAHFAAFPQQSWLVKHVIQPNFSFFAPQVYSLEVLIAISLILGLWTRIGSVLGGLMALNLWLGLYRAPYEWPWTYFFLILLQFTFAVLHVGRSLGVDAILARREHGLTAPRRGVARVLAYLT